MFYLLLVSYTSVLLTLVGLVRHNWVDSDLV